MNLKWLFCRHQFTRWYKTVMGYSIRRCVRCGKVETKGYYQAYE